MVNTPTLHTDTLNYWTCMYDIPAMMVYIWCCRYIQWANIQHYKFPNYCVFKSPITPNMSKQNIRCKKKGSYPEAHWFYPCTSRSKIRNQSLKYRTGRHNPPQSLKDEIRIKWIGLTLNKTQFRLLLQSTGERSKARGGSALSRASPAPRNQRAFTTQTHRKNQVNDTKTTLKRIY